MIPGTGKFRYRVVEDWGRDAQGPAWGLISGVAVDSHDRVYLFNRTGRPAVFAYDREGRFLTAWGDGVYKIPHGILIDDKDQVYLTDLEHFVHFTTLQGSVLKTLGTPGLPGAPGMPFNKPTAVALAPSGDIYVSDGYGQSRIHHFAPDGALLHSWGEAGTGPGQFNLPHSIAVDGRSRVFVTDRENNRIQIFDAKGAFLSQWPDLAWPMHVHIAGDIVYVAEGHQRVSIFSLDGELLARWGEKGTAPGQFTDWPHWICPDSRGDLYISAITEGNLLQKFERI